MEKSIFSDKTSAPDNASLKKELGKLFNAWEELKAYVLERSPSAVEEWNYSSLGWNYRIKDKKRVLIYLMPGHNEFRFSIVLGQKAIAELLAADIAPAIKDIISSSKTYAEGTGVRIEIKDKSLLPDLKKLADAKLKY